MSGWGGGGLLIGRSGGKRKTLPGEEIQCLGKEIRRKGQMAIIESKEGGVWIFSDMRPIFFVSRSRIFSRFMGGFYITRTFHLHIYSVRACFLWGGF